MDTIVERETKYDLEPGAPGPDLTRLRHGLVAVALPETRLSARYFDTSGLHLLRRGITLRHRRSLQSTEEDLWTLKLPQPVTGGAYIRTELSWPGAAGTVPAEARALLRAVTTGAGDLVAVATIVTVRSRHEIHDRHGRLLAEVDDDSVNVTAPVAKVFRQIEVELGPDGDDEVGARLAKRLRRAGAERSPDVPKLRLALDDRLAGPSSPPDGQDVPIEGSDDMTVGATVQATILRGLDGIVTQDVALRLGGSVEAVHQARVACRRLRSDLKTFAPVLEGAAVAPLSTELRWWAGVLGDVRDLDVLAGRVAGHARLSGPDYAVGFADVAARIAARRDTAWARVVAALDEPRYLDLLVSLEAAAASPPLREVPGPDAVAPAGHRVRHLVRRPWRRLRRAVEVLPPEPTDTELHRVRILAKQLRYASEAAAPVVGRPARRTARAAARIQTLLGDQHDAVVAEAALRSIAGGLSRRGALAAGLGIAAERQVQGRQRAAWVGAWDRLGGGRRPPWLRT